MTPAWQVLPPGVQADPAAQGWQEPEKQTWPAPQAVPLASGAPEETHCGRPVAQEVTPAEQGRSGELQATLGRQAPHRPAWQAWSRPQEAPSASGAPVSRQTSAPVAQLVRPAWQALAGVQARLARQAWQAPPRQAWSRPQLAPSGRGSAVGAQLASPASQATTPSVHGAPAGWQAAPATQTGVQRPAEQAWLAAQGRPSSALPTGPQNGAPETQATAPTWQGSGRSQRAPATQVGGVPGSGGVTERPPLERVTASWISWAGPTRTLGTTAVA